MLVVASRVAVLQVGVAEEGTLMVAVTARHTAVVLPAVTVE